VQFAPESPARSVSVVVLSPLADKSTLPVAARLLRRFVPSVASVQAIHFEYTPDKSLFYDQSARGGVDCDVLVEYSTDDDAPALLAIETKFVEPEFSICGFRRATNDEKHPTRRCPPDVVVGDDEAVCRYASKKHYKYWEQAKRLKTLDFDKVKKLPCPFGGTLWQLWVNHTLVHAEADRRNAHKAVFAVCAPRGNNTLLRDGRVLSDFSALVAARDSVAFIPVEDVIESLRSMGSIAGIGCDDWAHRLAARYIIP
jgi:putative intracellular protease/amidase